ncbi:glycosyltransferase [Nostoc sp. CHAB 5844]|nr:glycosyltransferase [Nostoc sp. CHAB 5844]
MINKRILIFYQFATIGGVERAIINRAIAFKAASISACFDVCFLKDYGGIAALNAAVDYYELHNYLRVVDRPIFCEYDLFISIDTPEILEFIPTKSKVIIECHTSRYAGQNYLRELKDSIENIMVPSVSMLDPISKITNRYVSIIPNRVSVDKVVSNKSSEKMNVFYVGRIEAGKNVIEALEIFANVHKIINDIDFLIVTPTDSYKLLYEKAKYFGVSKQIQLKGATSFHRMSKLYQNLSESKSLFLSSSLHETWGLSAAEALAYKMPVVLSSNSGHIEVVKSNESFLYSIGDIEEGVKKIINNINIKENIYVDELSGYHRRLSDIVDALVPIYELDV